MAVMLLPSHRSIHQLCWYYHVLEVKSYKTWVVLIGIMYMQNFVKTSQVVQKMDVGGQTHPQHCEFIGLLLGACWGVLLKSVTTLNYGLKSHWNIG